MADESSFTIRLLIFLQIAAGFLTMFTAYRYVDNLDLKFEAAKTAEGRLALTFRYLPISIIPVALTIYAVVIFRGMTTAINPMSGNEGLVQIKQRILVNTMEQFVFHAAVVLSYSTFLDESSFKFIPMLCLLFLIGRILFVIGYNIHYMARLYGFVLTFYPTLLVLAVMIWKLFNQNELAKYIQ